jgi:hypothetical protein
MAPSARSTCSVPCFGPDHFPRNLRAVEELKALAAKYGKVYRTSDAFSSKPA